MIDVLLHAHRICSLDNQEFLGIDIARLADDMANICPAIARFREPLGLHSSSWHIPDTYTYICPDTTPSSLIMYRLSHVDILIAIPDSIVQSGKDFFLQPVPQFCWSSLPKGTKHVVLPMWMSPWLHILITFLRP